MTHTINIDMENRTVAVVGGGIAAFTAALTLKNLQTDFLWLADGWGGKLPYAERVRNFPSFEGSGQELLAALGRQRLAEGIPFTAARIDGIFPAKGKFFLTAGERTFEAAAVILATGVEPGEGVRGEEEFLGKGVSYCAVCDGALYRGKEIAAVLSSPAFAEEAEYLASFAARVHLFCTCKDLPAFSAPNITVHGGSVRAVEGEGRVERVLADGESIPVSGVFFLRNSAPPQALVRGLKTEGGHVAVGRDLSTSVAGLFAAGDLTGRPYQYAKAAGEGLVAAYSARDFLRSL